MHNNSILQETGLTGTEIRRIREENGLTMEEFGEQLGLSKRQVWSLEHRDINNKDISDRIRAKKFVRTRKDYGISGERVAQIRKKEGLSQAEFGRRLGLTKRQVWLMEQNKTNSGARRKLVASMGSALVTSMEPAGDEIILSGKDLRLIRELSGLSQAGFAKILGLKQSTYSNMEHRAENSPELSVKVRDGFREEYEWFVSHYPVKRAKKEEIKVPNVGLTGVEIKTIRIFAGMSQIEFAKRIGISQPALSCLESRTDGNVRLMGIIKKEFPKEYWIVTARNPEYVVDVLSGQQVQQIRELTGLSQYEFGERIGMSQTGVNSCEHRNKITLSTSIKIQAVFREAYDMILKRPVQTADCQAERKCDDQADNTILQKDALISQLQENDEAVFPLPAMEGANESISAGTW